MDLLNEGRTISALIAKHAGLSNSLMSFITNKDYVFSYPEKNPQKIGEIVEYQLLKKVDTITMGLKEITITQYVILGSII